MSFHSFEMRTPIDLQAELSRVEHPVGARDTFRRPGRRWGRLRRDVT